MKSSSGAMRAWTADASANPKDLSVYSADLYTITLINGTVLRWNSSDLDITFAEGAIVSASVGSGGLGYAVGDTGTIRGPLATATYLVTSVSSGAVTGFSVSVAGSHYQVWNDCLTYRSGSQRGVGVGFTVNITAVSGSVTFAALSPSNPTAPTVERSRISSNVGFSVDDLRLDLNASPATVVNGIQLQSALLQGYFDNAAVLLQRIIMPTAGDFSLGTITLFSGTVGPLDGVSEVHSTITIKALTKILDIQMPRDVYSPNCINTLFDAGCTLNRASFLVSGTVSGGATVITVPTSLTAPGGIAAPASAPTLGSTSVSGLNLNAEVYYVMVTYVSATGETVASPEATITVAANRLLTVVSPPAFAGATGYNVYAGLVPGGGQRQNGTPIAIGTGWTEDVNGLLQGAPPPLVSANGYYAGGTIAFTSGANSGIRASVTIYDGSGVLHLLRALPHAPTAGDAFVIVPTCDLQYSTCDQKFHNLINFRGCPFIPTPESVL